MSQLKVNNITPVAGTTLSISGSLHVRDNITFSGSLTTVGDSSNDAVLFNAGVSSSITPTATNKYDLGTTTKRWKSVFSYFIINRYSVVFICFSNSIIFYRY